jgi:DNA helicase HerA-like ATPase
MLSLAESTIPTSPLERGIRRDRPAFPEGFRLPGARDRLAIMGRTGSGKTHFANWVLSGQNWPFVPWVIVDYKYDSLIGDIPGLEEIGLDGKIPKHPGLYVVHPRPDEIEEVERFLWKIWERGRTGVYVDEGHILPDKGSLQALLTQGRSKSIPMVILTQRPAWVNRFVFSEADFYSVFHLNDKRDRQTIASFVPVDLERSLPQRHSHYYDISRDRAFHMLPVPGRPTILDRFERRNPNRSRWSRI